MAATGFIGVPGGWAARSAGLLRGAWHDLTMRDVLIVALAVLGYCLLQLVQVLPAIHLRLGWPPAINLFVSAESDAMAVLFAVRVADRAIGDGPFRWGPYVLAVVVGVLAATAAAWLLTQPLLGLRTAYVAAGEHERLATFLFRHATHALPVSGMAVIVYLAKRRESQRRAALSAAQRQRARTERALLEAELATMQARIEPGFLLDSLARVQREYARHGESGDAMLQSLARYLRAAIPRSRDPESTVGKELELGRAYVAVVAGREGASMAVRIADEVTAAASLPPMLLLPLLAQALAAGAPAAGGTRRTLQVEARLERALLHLTLRDSGHGFDPAHAQAEPLRLLRARLAALYGGSATLALAPTAAGSAATLTIPQPG